MPEQQTRNEEGVPKPSRDKVAQELARIEMATTEEEEERRLRGLTQEPVAVRQKKEISKKLPPSGNNAPPHYNRHMPMPSAEALGIERGETRSAKGKESELLNYVAGWIVENRGYELGHLDHGVDVRGEGEMERLPVTFLDFLIDKATKGDMDKDVRDLLWSTLRDVRTIKVHITNGEIILGLYAPSTPQNPVRLYFDKNSPFDFYKAE